MQIRNDNVSIIAYLNLALTWAKGVMVLLLAMFALISVQNNESETLKPKAEMIVEMNWQDFSNHDLDIWLKTPTDEILFYAFKEAMNGLVSLERDDRGFNNSLDDLKIPTRQETIVFRSMVDGSYAITAHLYKVDEIEGEVGDALPQSIPFSIKIITLNPVYRIVFSKNYEFQKIREEKFILRFRIEKGKFILDEYNIPLSLLYGIFPKEEFVMPESVVQ